MPIQIVINLAQKVNPKGFRTLGELLQNPESEKAFLALARNEDVSFRLGWHVLGNRGWADSDCSTEERHANEESFFFQGV